MTDDDARDFAQRLQRLESQATHTWRHVSELEEGIAALMDEIVQAIGDDDRKLALVLLEKRARELRGRWLALHHN